MIIKKYMEFIKESINGYKYGCVMVEVPVSNWDEITSMIDPSDIYDGGDSTHGKSKNPHVTIFYGLHDDVTEEMVKSVFDNFGEEIHIDINGIGVFENKDFDVVKLDVNPDGSLQHLFDELSKFPNSNEYPEYKPHITISYVKSGTGKKYANPNYKHTVNNVHKMTYSMANGEKKFFSI